MHSFSYSYLYLHLAPTLFLYRKGIEGVQTCLYTELDTFCIIIPQCLLLKELSYHGGPKQCAMSLKRLRMVVILHLNTLSFLKAQTSNPQARSKASVQESPVSI